MTLPAAFERIYEHSGLHHQLDLLIWQSCILYQLRICLSIRNKLCTLVLYLIWTQTSKTGIEFPPFPISIYFSFKLLGERASLTIFISFLQAALSLQF